MPRGIARAGEAPATSASWAPPSPLAASSALASRASEGIVGLVASSGVAEADAEADADAEALAAASSVAGVVRAAPVHARTARKAPTASSPPATAKGHRAVRAGCGGGSVGALREPAASRASTGIGAAGIGAAGIGAAGIGAAGIGAATGGGSVRVTITEGSGVAARGTARMGSVFVGTPSMVSGAVTFASSPEGDAATSADPTLGEGCVAAGGSSSSAVSMVGPAAGGGGVP